MYNGAIYIGVEEGRRSGLAGFLSLEKLATSVLRAAGHKGIL